MNFRKLLIRPELGAVIAAVGIFILFAVVAGQQDYYRRRHHQLSGGFRAAGDFGDCSTRWV